MLVVLLSISIGCSEDAAFNSASVSSSTNSGQNSDSSDISIEYIESTPGELPKDIGTIDVDDIDPINKEDADPIDIDDIQTSCVNRTQRTAEVRVHFPKPKNTCQWGRHGNLLERNTYFQARIEQTRNLNLPSGAVICDAKFDFAQQDFLYDDHFLLLFNRSVIASSYNFESRLTKGAHGLLNYSWSNIAGMWWDEDKEQIYCPQIPGTSASCSFPGHDSSGKINLSYSSSYVQNIMAGGLPENHSFTMVSMGDNDSRDCEHSDVEFVVTLSYVQ